MLSMTGIGCGAFDQDYSVDIVIYTLNKKYLDVVFKSSCAGYVLEEKIRNKLRSSISRGQVFVDITCQDKANSGYVKYKDSCMDVCNHLGLEFNNTVFQFCLFDKIGGKRGHETLMRGTDNGILYALDLAIVNLIESRRKEGTHIQEELLSRVKSLEAKLGSIVCFVSCSGDKVSDLVIKKILSMGLDPSIISGQEQSLSLLLKHDIEEEINRLKIHLARFKELIFNEGPVGRMLDFVAQEISREVCTIGSKSLFSEVSSLSVDMKSDVEKIREQVQNVE